MKWKFVIYLSIFRLCAKFAVVSMQSTCAIATGFVTLLVEHLLQVAQRWGGKFNISWGNGTFFEFDNIFWAPNDNYLLKKGKVLLKRTNMRRVFDFFMCRRNHNLHWHGWLRLQFRHCLVGSINLIYDTTMMILIIVGVVVIA